jgi:hypothetical protein
MAGPISQQDLARLRQAMFLGLARQPLGLPEALQALLAAAPGKEPALAALALAGQLQRFERPVVERGAGGVPEAARRLHDDPRPILPEPARRLLQRLANGAEKAMAGAVVQAAVRKVMNAGFRLHPFDLPRLVAHIKGHAACLGLAERAYLALAEAPGKPEAPNLLHAEIAAENWTEFPKGHRVAFLREERRRDAAAARALLEGVFKSETATVRADLLAALEVGLGPDDLPFLDSLAADRSEGVRNVAVRLAAGVPGTPAYTQRLADAAGCFVRADRGSSILKRIGLAGSAGVVFNPPVAKTDQRAMLSRLFEGLSPAEIARVGGLATAEIMAALPEGIVMETLCEKALRDCDDELVAQLCAQRLAAIEAGKHSPTPMLGWLAEKLTEPVTIDFGKALLASSTWWAVLDRFKEAAMPAAMRDDGTLIWTASVLPPELMAAFQDAISDLPPVTARSARDLADLVLALDTLKPSQG